MVAQQLPATGSCLDRNVGRADGLRAGLPPPQRVVGLYVTAAPPVPAETVLDLLNNPKKVASLTGTLPVAATYAGEPH